jgi:hypothetical protein
MLRGVFVEQLLQEKCFRLEQGEGGDKCLLVKLMGRVMVRIRAWQ